jgi:hypothetical protein
MSAMSAARKITVHVPADLLRRAQEATGEGITPTVRRALEIVAAGRGFDQLRRLRGKVKFSVDFSRLREDRT